MIEGIWAVVTALLALIGTVVTLLIKEFKDSKKIDEIESIIKSKVDYSIKDSNYDLKIHDSNLDKHIQRIVYLFDKQEDKLSGVYEASKYVNKIRDGFEIKKLKASDFVEFIDYSMSEINEQKDSIERLKNMIKEKDELIESLENELNVIKQSLSKDKDDGLEI